MFRTVRGFLTLAPPAFLAALLAYLSAKPRAVSTFTVYPFLAEVLASGLPRSSTAKFVVVTTLFFIVPYLVAGVVLFLADAGASASAALWRKDRRPSHPGRARQPGAGGLLDSGGDLASPGRHRRSPATRSRPRRRASRGVNVAPVFVAAVPFVAVGAGLLLALLASIPRAVVRLLRRRSDPARGL
ncbi:MAG: hypothetical protein IPL90_03240 [Holophagales bacterium]|nr:hypothetical protein [Holophagales bacterium]